MRAGLRGTLYLCGQFSNAPRTHALPSAERSWGLSMDRALFFSSASPTAMTMPQLQDSQTRFTD